MGTGKRGKKAIGIAIAAVMIASIFGMIVPALGFHNVPVPPGDEGIYLLNPRNSSESYCNSITIDVWVNSSVADLKSGRITIETSDKSCANIIDCWVNGTQWPQSHICAVKDGGKKVVLSYAGVGGPGIQNPPGNYHIGTFTVHCNSSTGCLAGLNTIPEKPDTYVVNETYPLPESFGVGGEPGTFACNKSLPVGWNLVSRPDITADNSTASVLAGVYYDAVYRYDANSDTFVDVSDGTMEPGIGYFVHVAAPSNWTFTGTPYTQMNISLEPGLNMIGWLDCTKPISEALSSIEGKYWYVARWNATTQEYETYNPVAPPPFNDFDTLEPTTGYWISMKESGWLNASC